MGDRGRKSGSELALISNSGVVAVERPRPPVELTEEQAAEWRALVNAHAADRFGREQFSMLTAHCVHTCAQRLILRMTAKYLTDVENGAEFDIAHLDRLQKMQERESRCLASLAVRLGFAYSTAYEKRPEKGKTDHGPLPWQVDEA